jgi:hypothetical protein
MDTVVHMNTCWTRGLRREDWRRDATGSDST